MILWIFLALTIVLFVLPAVYNRFKKRPKPSRPKIDVRKITVAFTLDTGEVISRKYAGYCADFMGPYTTTAISRFEKILESERYLYIDGAYYHHTSIKKCQIILDEEFLVDDPSE